MIRPSAFVSLAASVASPPAQLAQISLYTSARTTTSVVSGVAVREVVGSLRRSREANAGVAYMCALIEVHEYRSIRPFRVRSRIRQRNLAIVVGHAGCHHADSRQHHALAAIVVFVLAVIAVEQDELRRVAVVLHAVGELRTQIADDRDRVNEASAAGEV